MAVAPSFSPLPLFPSSPLQGAGAGRRGTEGKAADAGDAAVRVESPGAHPMLARALSLTWCAGCAVALSGLGTRRSSPSRLTRLMSGDGGDGAAAKLPPLILGSKSATRQGIAQEMGFTFRVETADIDERAIGDRSGNNVEDLVLLLGKAKAEALLPRLGDEPAGTVLLTGDQVVTHGGNVLEKPLDLDEARRFIKRYTPGNPCSTVGSVVLTDLDSGRRVSGTDTCTIHFEEIPDDIIDVLLEEGLVLHCAGGLMIEHPLVQPFITKIEGDEDSVMGLSSRLTKRLLKRLRKGEADED